MMYYMKNIIKNLQKQNKTCKTGRLQDTMSIYRNLLYYFTLVNIWISKFFKVSLTVAPKIKFLAIRLTK